ncbi:hypothetical protein NTGHW29_380035 [Candidatus Nitrotoga sp. HW29]|nr:hypothetical protein [Candidatus Nitrotoga sp. HW29]CAH1904843.1 hypothetical protein NTGHW29_380035 [Candidatus Nitrotoga sp. HW29]
MPVLISNRSSLPEVTLEAALVVEAEDVKMVNKNIRVLLEDSL